MFRVWRRESVSCFVVALFFSEGVFIEEFSRPMCVKHWWLYTMYYRLHTSQNSFPGKYYYLHNSGSQCSELWHRYLDGRFYERRVWSLLLDASYRGWYYLETHNPHEALSSQRNSRCRCQKVKKKKKNLTQHYICKMADRVSGTCEYLRGTLPEALSPPGTGDTLPDLHRTPPVCP